MKYKNVSLILISLISLACSPSYTRDTAQAAKPVKVAIDAAKDGTIYGDVQGLIRVLKLEQQLHTMTVRQDHPRIFVTPETVDIYRSRAQKLHFSAMSDILQLAEQGDIANLGFAFLMLEKSDPTSANLCLQKALKILKEYDPNTGDKNNSEREIAKMALAFDWLYNGMNDTDRKAIADKLSHLTNIDSTAEKIRKGFKACGETFHREEWIFHSWRAWPEIALAHHNPNAEFVYVSRWRYDWYWGDAARMYAYAADGTPFEGYYYGADGIDWFLALKSATGINLVDSDEFGWGKNAAYYVLYRLDLDRGREILHHGAALGAAGAVSYKQGTVAWKIKGYLNSALSLAQDNPYVKGLVNKDFGVSNWLITVVTDGGLPEFGAIAQILFADPAQPEKDLKDASYDDLPLARLFPGGNEAYMRTGWYNKPVCVGFRSAPAYTKTSHGDYDVNTFVIYKDGVLSPDSGVYDAYEGQGNYFRYQKNTGAHNDILIIDPAQPDEPRKLVDGTPDPGGVRRVSTRTLSGPSAFGFEETFLHNAYANWSHIVDFKTTPQYDYVTAEAAAAYFPRLKEFFRSLVFIRKGGSAYVLVFDRVESQSENYIKKALVHLVGEPKMSGKLIRTRVPGHYEFFDAQSFESMNALNTSKLYSKILLPAQRVLAKIGGDGYDYYVEGSSPKNYGIGENSIKRIEEQMGGSWLETGRWRIEIIPGKNQKRDYFLQAMYVTDANGAFNPDNITLQEDDTSYIVKIKDDVLGGVAVSFTKNESPQVAVAFGK